MRCYGNVSLKDIMVYVYPAADNVPVGPTRYEVEKLKARLPQDIKMEFLEFPDWAWARSYKITVVDRIFANSR